jgi:Sec23/Sec24 zinc finger/Sec23/Sec24 trunk domain
MFFAGKAYVKKSNPKEAASEAKEINEEEAKIEEAVFRGPARKIRRQKSTERLSISSLNHSLNSNSGSDSDDDEEKADQVPLELLGKQKFEMHVDTNVVSLDLGSLKEAVVMATGDPIFCKKCSAAFNLYSRVNEINENQQLWICEFCSNGNEISIDTEEIPRGKMLDYMLMSSSQVIEESKEVIGDTGDITIIFCIDISGSMCVTEPVNGRISLKVKKNVDLGGFADFDMSEQFLEGDDQVTYISRLECVQAAIESQLESMSILAPKRKIGLVTFNSDITIYGDGTSDPVILTGDKLNSFESCFDTGLSLQNKLKKPIEDTKGDLMAKLLTLTESGPTALGPALVSSIGLVSSHSSGSRVIICTDGIANVGIGRLDDDTSVSDDFYARVAQIAKDKGIEISVISIEGEECKLSKLSTISEVTGGEVTRVNMNNIVSEFANILETPVIATQVSTIIKIHKGLCFRYQDENLVDSNTLKKDLGNVVDGSEFTFEYSVRSIEELKALEINLDDIKQLPFQSQIHFTTKDGMKCMRVITSLQDTTDNLDEAGDINLKILGVNAAHRCAHLASKGEYRESQAVMRSWKRMMKRNAKNSEQKETVDYYVENLSAFNRNINGVASNQDIMMLNLDERVCNQNDSLNHMAFRAKKASKSNKKECSIM